MTPTVAQLDQCRQATRSIGRACPVVSAADGRRVVGAGTPGDGDLVALLPPIEPAWLGDRSFGADHGIRYPYMVGEMAHGISSAELVVATAQAGGMASLGAGGMPLPKVRDAVGTLARRLGTAGGWAVNLIHSPLEPQREQAMAELLLAERVPVISLSAFMDVTPTIVQVACQGLTRTIDGGVHRPRRIMAKVSRPEIAAAFASPAPAAVLATLVESGRLSAAEAELAARVPLADDITAEADSGGHTDQRAALVIMGMVHDAVVRAGQSVRWTPRVGLAGGIGAPSAVAAAFAAGAAYVVTGSINQFAAESGVPDEVREMLAATGLADFGMAPSADMFSLGGQVQVVRRGTMFVRRARQLLDVHRQYPSIAALPADLRGQLERDQFAGTSLDDAWRATADYWRERDPEVLARAQDDPHLQMELVFRSYLGRTTKWALRADESRRLDFQIWAGPAVAAFNQWRAGSVLAGQLAVPVRQIMLNLLYGAACITRAQQLRTVGVEVPDDAFQPRPRIIGEDA